MEPNQVVPQNQAAAHNGKATTGLVMGIVALVFNFIPLINFLVIPLAIIGLVFSILGMKSEKRGQAIAGLILNIVALLFFIVLMIIGIAILSSLDPSMLDQME